MELWTA